MRIVKECTPYFKFSLEKINSEAVGEYCRFLTQSFGWYDIAWQDKKWRFNDPQIAAMIKEKFPETEMKIDIEGELIDRFIEQERDKVKLENIRRIKEGGESKIEIKGINGDLYNYQKLGVEFFINSNGRAILSDSMGIGKSLQAIAYITTSNFKKALIISPASAKFSWEKEIKKWTNLKSYVINSKTNFKDIPKDTVFYLINYDILKKFYKELMSNKWEVLVTDECQMIKSRNAIRSRAVKQLSCKIPRVLLLSGTPLLSRTAELFNLLNIVDPAIWNNWFSYATRYCGGEKTENGFEAKGSTNLEELNQRIDKYFLRRKKEEVLKELPPKIRIEVPVELKEEDKKKYNLITSDLISFLKKFEGSTDPEIERIVKAKKLVQFGKLRQVCASGKIELAEELIQRIVDGGEKVLVFCSYNSPLEELQKRFVNNSVILTGKVMVSSRGNLVSKFQEDNNIQIFFGGIKSAGTAITLTAASSVVFIDQEWNPADMLQSEDRIHRLGQKASSLNIYHLICQGTIDDIMLKVQERKQNIFDTVIEGKKVDEEGNLIDEFIKTLTNKQNICQTKNNENSTK